MPENTTAAKLHAIDLGVTTLELDVVISRDSQVVLSHEAYFHPHITTLKRQTDTSFSLRTMVRSLQGTCTGV